MPNLDCITTAILLFCLLPQKAHAYIGPGLSVGGIIVLLIVIFSICLAFYAIVWFPIKRRLKAQKTDSSTSQDQV